MLNRLAPWVEAVATVLFIFLVIAALFVLIHVAKFVFFLLMGTVLLVCVVGFIFIGVLASVKAERERKNAW